MARPTIHTMRVIYDADRKQPWGVRWRATVEGERATQHKFFATEAEAHAFKAQHEQLAATLAPPPAPAAANQVLPRAAADELTYRQFATDWVESVIKRRKPSTARSYRGVLATHIYPHLGDTPVKTIGVPEVVAVITARAQAGVKWGTQKAVLRVISTSLRWAVRQQLLDVNPALGLIMDLRDDSGEYVEPEPNPLTIEQAEAFLTWLQTGTVPGKVNRPVDGPKLRGGQLRQVGYPEYYPYFLGLVRTGMRRGEAAALKWTGLYLDSAKPSARLTENYSPSLKAAKPTSTGDGALKTKKSKRELDLADDYADVLRELARTRQADAFKAKRRPSPYVNVTPSGARITSDSATAERVFERGMLALGLEAEGHTIHDLRDTFATSHLIKGSPLLWVSQMLGHKKPSTTHDRYARWVPTQHTGGHAFASSAFPSRSKKPLSVF